MTRESLFQGVLADELDAFLAFKRALGYSYETADRCLSNFDRYVQAHAPRAGALPFDRLVQGWLAREGNRKSVTVGRDLTLLRQFFLFRRRHDPTGYVPPRRLAPQRRSHFEPHVLTLAEVRKMLATADNMCGPPIRRLTFRTLLLILYCTGLRVGEAIRLQLQDVDLHASVFHVRRSKGKTRVVPFKADLGRVLAKYLGVRPPRSANCDRLLVQDNGRPYSTTTASATLCRLFRRAGLKPSTGRDGPRPTDFRHTFAVHRLTRWYRAGVDLHARLPWLSAYMGHKDLGGTQVYLTATPELLAAASRRFEQRVHRGKQGR